METLATVRPTTERLSSAAHQTVDKLADSARPAVDRLASNAHQAVDKIAEAAAATAARLSTQAEQLKATRERATQAASSYVHDNPLTALGIAVAAGFLLSRLLNSR